MGGIQTLPRPTTVATVSYEEELDNDEGNKKHLIVGGTDAIMQAMVNGTRVVTLCGEILQLPQDPPGEGRCQQCQDIEKNLPNDSNPNSDSPDFNMPRRAKDD